MWFTLRYLYLVTVVLCIEQPRLENVEQVKESFNFRRAIDDGRDRKYSNYDDDGSYDSYHSVAGYYDSSQVTSGFSDIRNNVPGEPGVDYPAYESVPKTRFSCEGRAHGYYADEESGCQAFHVCHDVVVSSFICPIGAIFSQKLLTCDWWNKVDCTLTDDSHLSRQGIYKDTNEMVQKAYEMTVLRNINGIKSDPEIGRKQYYNYNPTDQPGVYGNLQHRNSKAIVNDNTQSQKNIINVKLQPKNLEVNHQGKNSGLDNREDSAIVYIQKDFNYNPQDSYPTSQPSRLGNDFKNSYQQNEKFVRYEFQPSYAPTVPTVTTTTRKLYSPTVPTTYRPSTISYNKDDQYFDGSNHFYTHGRVVNFPTTRPTIDYDDARVHDGRFENKTYLQRRINQQSDKPTANKRHDKYNFSEIVQSKESIGIAQSYREILNGGGNNREEETRSQTETNLQVGESDKQDTVLRNFGSKLENIRTPLGNQPTNSDSNVSGNQQEYQHFYTNQLSFNRRQGARAIETRDSVLAGNDTQAGSTEDTKTGKSVNSINSRLGIPPLIVEIPRPLGLSGRPLTDIADQLFTFDSFVNMSNSASQITQSAVSNTNSTDVTNRVQSSDSVTTIPPLIPESSQSATTTGSQTPSAIDNDETFDSLPKIPPLISDFPLSSGSTDVGDQSQGFDSTTGIPPLIPQSSLFATSTGSQKTDVIDDDKTFNSPPEVPPLFSEIAQSSESVDIDEQSQGSDSSTRIPPLISQSSQSATSTGSQTLSGIGDDDTFDSQPKIPPLISDLPLSSGSKGVDDQSQGFESTTRISPLIPQSSLFATSTGLQTPDVIDDDKTFDSLPKIPPLISDVSQSSASTDIDNQPQGSKSSTRIPPLFPLSLQSAAPTEPQMTSVIENDETLNSPPEVSPLVSEIPQSSESTDVDDQSQGFDSSTNMPPLIPQSSQSATSTGSQTTSVIENGDTFDSLPKLPPLISDVSQTFGSTDVDDQSQGFDSSTRIPPLIPQSTQSATSTSSQTASVIDDGDTFDSPPKLPPLISDVSQTFGSTDVDDQSQGFDSSTRIPPLIPQSSQSAISTGSQTTVVIDDDGTFDSPPKIPILISDLSPSSGSTDVDEQSQGFDLSTGILPLIPQSSQSATPTGSQTTSVVDDDGTFDSQPKIPPLMSDLLLSSGSTDVDDQSQGFESTTSILPLIPLSSQSATLTGTQTTSVIDDDGTFDSQPKVPPLISDLLLSSGPTDVDNRQQGFESTTKLPPLISQSSQSATSTGLQTTSVIDEDKTFDSPPKISPLISNFPLTSGSTDVDDQSQGFESTTGKPPLIPQSSQSATSTGSQTPSVINGDDTFNSPSKIPPLIPDFTLSSESTDVGNQPQSFESSTRIPPLIPQSLQSATSTGPQTPSVINDDDIFISPSKIPPLIPNFTPSSESPDVGNQPQSFESSTRIPPLIPQSLQSATSTGPQTPSVINDDDIFISPSKIPPLIPDFTLSSKSPDVGNQPQSFESSTRIPPLIPQSWQSATSTGPQTPSVINDDDIFISPSKIPPLIPDFTLSSKSPDVGNQPQSFESSTRIPPLIPQSWQSATSTGPQTPSVINDDDIFISPSKIPPLIPNFTQSFGSVDVGNQPQSFETPDRIPPLISQFSPSATSSATSSGPRSPSGIDNHKTVDSPPKSIPLIPPSPQSLGSSGLGSMVVIERPQTFESSTRIPLTIPQSSPSMGSSKADPSQVFDSKNKFHPPPRVPPFSSKIPQSLGLPGTQFTNIFDQRPTIYQPDSAPPLFLAASRPGYSSGTYPNNVFNSFNSFPSTTQSSYFTFQGQYQRPLPFSRFQTPTQLPEHQFVTTSTAKIPAYDFNIEYGSKLSLESTTHSPSRDFVEYPSKEFRINVPDFPITEEPSYSVQDSILSTPENPYLSDASHSKTLVYQSPSLDTIKMSNTATSHIIQTPVQPSKVVPQSPTIDYLQQSSVTDLPSMAVSLLPPKNHSYYPILTEQNAKQHIPTVVKGPTPTLSVPNVNHSDNNLFNQPSTTISPISDFQKPNSPDLAESGHKAENNDDLRYTMRGALPNSTATSSPSSNKISNSYLPQSNESPPGQRVFNAQDSNIDDGPIDLSYPKDPSYKEYQESTTSNIFDKVTLVGNNFVPISSPAYSDNFGYSKERFESSTPNNILETTYIKSAEKLNASGNKLLQASGTSGLSFDPPSGISQIQPSLNNHDSPYEIHFTVNANEAFNPSEDFINKLLAQHASNSPLGFDGFGGYEIIKSEIPEGGLDNVPDLNSSVLTNIEPSVKPDVPRLFDVRGSFGNNPSESHNGFSNQNLNIGPSIQTASETYSTGIQQLKSNNFARPFFFSNNQNVALQTGLKSANPSTINLPLSDSNVQPERWQNSINLSNLRVEPEDINRSLETLFEFVPQNFESSPLTKEQILEQLNQHFDQPLYNSNSQRNSVSSEASHIVSQVAESPNPVTPTPSIPKTPEPVKTVVETEFIPALSFSFDSDEGRKEYIDAVLQGLLTETKPVDHWTDDVNLLRDSRENSKPKNNTTKT